VIGPASEQQQDTGARLEAFNRLPAAEAEALLLSACASPRWAEGVAGSRPYAAPEDLLAAAGAVWRALGPDDWLAAFAAHPRIGDRSGAGERERAEQAGTAGADATTLAALERGNAEYEARFGHVFLICARGLDAPTMLAALRRRLGNDPVAELQVAAEEQRRITELRLRDRFGP
jgi:OHCU decarboxylase